MFDVEPRNVADIISCSLCCPSGGDFIKEILRELIFSYLKKIAKHYIVLTLAFSGKNYYGVDHK